LRWLSRRIGDGNLKEELLERTQMEVWENFGWGSEEGFATDLCTPTQNPNQLRNSGTHLQTILNVCHDLLAGRTQIRPRIYMLHTITGKILKSSYFWLIKNLGCYN
jgi:hypothetical protein